VVSAQQALEVQAVRAVSSRQPLFFSFQLSAISFQF
jgi:hypothetical protein